MRFDIFPRAPEQFKLSHMVLLILDVTKQRMSVTIPNSVHLALALAHTEQKDRSCSRAAGERASLFCLPACAFSLLGQFLCSGHQSHCPSRWLTAHPVPLDTCSVQPPFSGPTPA